MKVFDSFYMKKNIIINFKLIQIDSNKLEDHFQSMSKNTGKVLFGSAVHNSFQVTTNSQQAVDKVIVSDCDSIPSENNYLAEENKDSQYDDQGVLMHQRNVAENGGACKGYMSAYNRPASNQGYLETMGNQSVGAIVSIGNEISETEENDPGTNSATDNFRTDVSFSRQGPHQIYNKKSSYKEKIKDPSKKTHKVTMAQNAIKKLTISLVDPPAHKNSVSGRSGHQIKTSKKSVCQTPSNLTHQEQISVSSLQKSSRRPGQQVRQILLVEDESDNSFNEDMDEHFEGKKLASTRKAEKVGKPKQIAKPNKPLVSYSKALPVKKIELGPSSSQQKSEARLATATLLPLSADSTPNDSKSNIKKKLSQDIKITNVHKYARQVQPATGGITRRIHTSTSGAVTLPKSHRDKTKKAPSPQASKIPPTFNLKPSPMQMKSMKFTQLQQKSFTGKRLTRPFQKKKEHFDTFTPTKRHTYTGLGTQGSKSNIKDVRETSLEDYQLVNSRTKGNSIKNIQDLYCKTHTQTPTPQSEEEEQQNTRNLRDLDSERKSRRSQFDSHKSINDTGGKRQQKKLNQSSSANSIIYMQTSSPVTVASPYNEQAKAGQQILRGKRPANRRMDAIVNMMNEQERGQQIVTSRKIIKSQKVKIQGLVKQHSNNLNNYQEVANQMVSKRDNKLLKTIISNNNEEDESERHESKLIRALNQNNNTKGNNQAQQLSRTHSLTIQSSMQRIKSNQSLSKPENIPQNNLPGSFGVQIFKSSFVNNSVKKIPQTRRTQRSYSHINNNKTLDDNQSSLERILGTKQASRLFDTLERVLKTTVQKDWSIPRARIETSKSQMQIPNSFSRNNMKVSPMNTLTKTIDLAAQIEKNVQKLPLTQTQTAAKKTTTSRSPRPPIGHRREISSPDVHFKNPIFKDEASLSLNHNKQHTFRGISSTVPKLRLSHVVNQTNKSNQKKSGGKRDNGSRLSNGPRQIGTNPNTSRVDSQKFGGFSRKVSHQQEQDEEASTLSVNRVGSTTLRKFNSGTKSLKNFILQQKKELVKARVLQGSEVQKDQTLVYVTQSTQNNQAPKGEPAAQDASLAGKSMKDISKMSGHKNRSGVVLGQAEGEASDELIDDENLEAHEDLAAYLPTAGFHTSESQRGSLAGRQSARRKKSLRKSARAVETDNHQEYTRQTFAVAQTANQENEIQRVETVGKLSTAYSQMRPSEANQLYSQVNNNKERYRNEMVVNTNMFRESIQSAAGGYNSSFFKKEQWIEAKLQNILHKNQLKQQKIEDQDTKPEHTEPESQMGSKPEMREPQKAEPIAVDKIDLSRVTMQQKNLARERTEQIYFKKEQPREEDVKAQDSIFIYDNNDEAMANYMECQPQCSRDIADIRELQDEIDKYIGNLKARPDQPEIPQNVLDELKAEIEAEQRAAIEQSLSASNQMSPPRLTHRSQLDFQEGPLISQQNVQQIHQLMATNPHQYSQTMSFQPNMAPQQMQYVHNQTMQMGGFITAPSQPQTNQFDMMGQVQQPQMFMQPYPNPMMGAAQSPMGQNQQIQINNQAYQYVLVPVDQTGRPVMQNMAPNQMMVQNVAQPHQMQQFATSQYPQQMGMNPNTSMYSPRAVTPQMGQHNCMTTLQNNFSSGAGQQLFHGQINMQQMAEQMDCQPNQRPHYLTTNSPNRYSQSARNSDLTNQTREPNRNRQDF